MTAQTIGSNYLYSERAESIHDLLLVSSFGVWAVLLGLSPVLALNFLVGS